MNQSGNCPTCGGLKYVRVLRQDEEVKFADYECDSVEVADMDWLLKMMGFDRCGISEADLQK